MASLNVVDHSRDAVGMKYVYPVLSRRAGGVSVGINLSPNNACNFRCIYCQVPDLSRGQSPGIDLSLLERELSTLLQDIREGTFLKDQVPEGQRTLKDLAFSGNGEPTSSPDFSAAVRLVGKVLQENAPGVHLPVVLISNGTLMSKPSVIEGLEELKKINGRVWFKLDSSLREGFQRINDTPLDPAAHLRRLRDTAHRLPLWVQTCVFSWDAAPPPRDERDAYLATLAELCAEAVPIRGVHLYSLARPSLQREAPRLGRLSTKQMEEWAGGIRELGLLVDVHS